MKFKNLKVNFGALKGLKGKVKSFWNGKSKKQKKAFAVTSGVSFAVVMTMLTACHINNGKTNEEVGTLNIPTTTSTIDEIDEVVGPMPQVTTVPVATETTQTTTEFLSDTLDNIDINVADELNTDEIAEQIAQSVGDVVSAVAIDENGNDISGSVNSNGEIVEDVYYSGNYYEAPDGQIYSSEENYSNSNQGSTTIIDNGGYNDLYVDEYGNYWTSYEEYINSLDEGTTNVEVPSNDDNGTNSEDDSYGDEAGYTAPDGTLWASEEAYNDSINPNYIDDDLFVAPDGSLWDSEEAYNNYLKDIEEVYGPNDSDELEDPVTEETDGYRAPDGTYWNSEEEYKEHVNSQDEEYYVAPDGTLWASEEDYNNSINNSVVTTTPEEETKEITTTTVTTVEPNIGEPPIETTTEQVTEKPVETTTEQVTEKPAETTTEQVTEDQQGQGTIEENNYYIAPDGSVWASYEDYLIFTNGELENTDSKTR